MGLGLAILPLLALAASLTAAVAVGSLIVAWLRKPDYVDVAAVTEPDAAGLLAVGFVSGAASGRWLPATVLELAAEGVIAIEDRRAGRDGELGRPRDIRLVFEGHPAVESTGAASGDASTGVVDAVFDPVLTGGSSQVVRGSSVEVDEVVQRNGSLAAMTRERFVDAAAWYRERRPTARLRAATIGAVIGIGLGLLLLASGDDAAASLAWSAIALGAIALALRALLPRWIPLNGAGLRLRIRANELRDAIAGADVPTVAAGARLLPWAVLFGEQGTVDRFAEAAARERTVPTWYRSPSGFTAARLRSCVAAVTAELSQPISVGGTPLARDDGRFGVPMVGDTKGWGAGYLGGGGGGGGGGGEFGGDGYTGGFDGGGFDGGGFGGDGGGGN